MSKYLQGKAKARQDAINFQYWASQQALSWNELFVETSKFYRLGKRYGLLKEFKENGVL